MGNNEINKTNLWSRIIGFLFGNSHLGNWMLKQNIGFQILVILVCVGLIYAYVQYRTGG